MRSGRHARQPRRGTGRRRPYPGRALDTVRSGQPAAVQARAPPLSSAVALLASAVGALGSVALALRWVGIGGVRWDPRQLGRWGVVGGGNGVLVIIGGYGVIRGGN